MIGRVTAVLFTCCLIGCGQDESAEPSSGDETPEKVQPELSPIIDLQPPPVEDPKLAERSALLGEAIELLKRFAGEIVSIELGNIKSAKMAVLEIELLEIEFQELGVKMVAAGQPDKSQAALFRQRALEEVSEVQDERFVQAVEAIGKDTTINQLVTGAANRFRDALDQQIFRDYGIGGSE